MIRSIAIALSLSIFISCIGHASEDKQPERKQVIFLKEKCSLDAPPQTRALGAIATILLPKFLEAGIEAGFAALKNAAADKDDAKFAKSEEFKIAKVTPDGKITTNDTNSCLVYFDGYFTKENSNNQDQTESIKSLCDNAPDCILKNAVKSHLFFESKLEISSERRLKATIKKLFFGEPVLQNSFFATTKERDLVITIDFLSYEADKPYGSIAFPINNAKPNSELIADQDDFLGGIVTVLPKDSFTKAIEKQNNATSELKTTLETAHPKSTLTPVEEEAEKSSEVKTALKNLCASAPDKIVEEICPGGLGELQRALIKARAQSIKNINKQRAIDGLIEKDLGRCKDNDISLNDPSECNIEAIEAAPIYVKVTATETRKGSPFWTKVANIMLSSKGDIAKTLSDDALLDRDAKKAEDADQKASLLRKLEEAEDSVRLAEASQLALPTSSSEKDKLTAEIALKKAKMDVNAAARKLGIARPYPELP